MSETAGQAAESGGDDSDRRGALAKLAAVIIGTIVGLAPLVAGALTFLDPLMRRKQAPEKHRAGNGDGKEGYHRICDLEALPEGGAPQRFPVIANQFDGWNFTPRQPIGSVYIQRTGPGDIRVFNTTCPHAGCSVNCDGSAFLCPCHNSAFNLDGTKLADDSGRENPSPRALDTLEVDNEKLAAGEVWVEFQNFYTGREEKTPKI